MIGLKNTVFAYGIVARLFHWVMGVAILAMLALGLWMDGLPPGPDKWQIYGIHKAVGVLLLGSIVLRFIWRQWSLVPALPAEFSSLERLAAHGTLYLLYLLMLVMPLSGWAMSSAGGYEVSVFGWYTLPPLIEKNKVYFEILKEVHEYLGYVLIALIALHVLAALQHHFIRRDGILRRMLPW